MNPILRYRLLNRLRHFWSDASRSCSIREVAVLQQSLPALIRNIPAQTFPTCAVSVHMLLSRRSLVMGLWAARSFQHFTRRCWKIIFHDDGSLRDEDAALLQQHFPQGAVWRRGEADRKVEAALAGYPHSLQNRRKHIMFLKLFDPYFACEGDRFMLLDSDVLFFQAPQEILEWADAPQPDFRFNSDLLSAHGVAPEKLETRYGLSLWKKVNAGLALIPREGVSLDLVEDYLREFSSQSIHDLWLEQTAYALLATKFGWGGLLPPTYEISFNPARGNNCVARHYVTTDNSRQHFFREGVITLAPLLLR